MRVEAFEEFGETCVGVRDMVRGPIGIQTIRERSKAPDRRALCPKRGDTQSEVVPPLRGFGLARSLFRGLTPTAIQCRSFGAKWRGPFVKGVSIPMVRRPCHNILAALPNR